MARLVIDGTTLIVKKQLLQNCCRGLFEPTLTERGFSEYQLLALDDAITDGLISLILQRLLATDTAGLCIGTVRGMYITQVSDKELQPDEVKDMSIAPLLETTSMMATNTVMEELNGTLSTFTVKGASVTAEQWSLGFVRSLVLVARTLLQLNQYGYSHNDLHTGNILYRYVPEGVTMRFDIGEGPQLIGLVKVVPVIIDHGRANLTIEEGTLFENQEAFVIEGDKHNHPYLSFDLVTYLVFFAGIRKRTPMLDSYWELVINAIGWNSFSNEERLTIENSNSAPSFDLVDKSSTLETFINSLLPWLRQMNACKESGYRLPQISWSSRIPELSDITQTNDYTTVVDGMQIGNFVVPVAPRGSVRIFIAALDPTKVVFRNFCCDTNMVHAMDATIGPCIAFNGVPFDPVTRLPIGTVSRLNLRQESVIDYENDLINFGEQHHWVQFEKSGGIKIFDVRPEGNAMGFSSNQVLVRNGRIYYNGDVNTTDLVGTRGLYPGELQPVYKYSCEKDTLSDWKRYPDGFKRSCTEPIAGTQMNYNERMERTFLVTTEKYIYVFVMVQVTVEMALSIIVGMYKPIDVIHLSDGFSSSIGYRDQNGNVFYNRQRVALNYMSHVIVAQHV